MRDKFEHTKCVVTGATSGNGRAVALALHKMGATVYAFGRDRERRNALIREGIYHTYYMDLEDSGSIRDAVVRVGHGVDYVFHLAGNALIGSESVRPSDERLRRFRRSDLLGPQDFFQCMIPRMAGVGVISMVTSASAGLGDVPAIQDYQVVKRGMVEWWATFREAYEDHGIHLMLISMGFIDTGVWDRVDGLPAATKRVVRLFVPGPDFYARQIIRDAMNRKPVSYPGVGAWMAPVDLDGKYHPPEVVKKALTYTANKWFRMFPTDTGAQT